ncbi:hypothetical protein FACS1894137_09760 [Spirochaetia bacterium]|nr:hypothetical protein FACS1894137_09760 [Spirochaetia bacterium]
MKPAAKNYRRAGKHAPIAKQARLRYVKPAAKNYKRTGKYVLIAKLARLHSRKLPLTVRAKIKGLGYEGRF